MEIVQAIQKTPGTNNIGTKIKGSTDEVAD